MKKFLLTLTIASAALSISAAKPSNDTTIVVKLDKETPMHCENCEKTICGDLRFEKGVKKIDTSLDAQTVTIRYDKRRTTAGNLRTALERLGYKPE